MSHASTAARVRAAKEKDPSRYCAHPTCLWRTDDTYCPRHAVPCERCGARWGTLTLTAKGAFCPDCVEQTVQHAEDPHPDAIARQEQNDWERSR